METMRSPGAGRFIGLTFVLGGVAWAILTILVLGNVLAGLGNFTLGPASSRIVAGGGAGSWFTMGILAYGLVAGGGMGVTALFYQHVEGTLGSRLTGRRKIGPWGHLVLGGAGSGGGVPPPVGGGGPPGGR